MGNESSRAKPTVTMQAVAEAAGVSRAAVSLAFRDHPSIPETTRRKIREAAERLGYQRNALISTLMASIRTGRSISECPVLVWLSSEFHAESRRIRFFGESETAARRRAEQLGFRLEVQAVPKRAPEDWSRVRRVLLARGVQGVVFSPHSALPPRMEEWLEPFAAVAHGSSHGDCRLHRVIPYHFHSCRLALACMKAGADHKVGLWIPHGLDTRTDHALLGGYLTYWMERGLRPPPVLWDKSFQHDSFRKWLRRAAPDAILVPSQIEASAVSSAHRGFHSRIALMDWEPGSPWPGVDQLPSHIGSSLIELLIAQIHRNERGLPPFAKAIVIEPTWREAAASTPIDWIDRDR